MPNRATLAAAGSRKTQELVEHCAALPDDRRVLLVTFTRANQAELVGRLSCQARNHLEIKVLGWYAFLIRDFARPFLPFHFAGERVRGFNFEGRPNRYATGKARFLDANGQLYASELGRLARELMDSSGGALTYRLESIYDELLIDEVQDLSGYDWDILDVLLNSRLDVWMVGDLRQSVISTNPRGQRNRQYAYADAIDWFRERQEGGVLEIHERPDTWRCRPEIAAFSDSIFEEASGFSATISRNQGETGHDGVFLVRTEHLEEYIGRFQPQILRHDITFGKQFEPNILNFGASKGLQFERVLILPTDGISNFVRSGAQLAPTTACKLYVAVTRAAQSVAILLDEPRQSRLPTWRPE